MLRTKTVESMSAGALGATGRSALGGTATSPQAGQSATAGSGTPAPDDIDFTGIVQLMTSKYTVELVDRHVSAIRKVCKTCCNGFLLKHLEPLGELLRLAIERFSHGQDELAPAICDFTRIASLPFVSCKASDMITYGHHLPPFLKALVSVLTFTLPPADESHSKAEDQDARRSFEERRSTYEGVRIEVAHTLACWARFGLDEESVDLRPNQSLIQAVADSGTPNLRILRQSQVIDALSASFRAEDSPEAIVITLGAIRDMSLYRPLARQITNCGLISNLIHVIRVNLLGSDVLLVAAEVLWNLLELDWEGAATALGQAEVIEAFRDFMDTVLSRGYRFKDKIFRNDMMVLLMYISKRAENRPLFASTGLMALLLSHAVTESQRRALRQSGALEALLQDAGLGRCSGFPASEAAAAAHPAPQQGGGGASTVVLTNSQEDMEFRMLLWGTLARCCSSESCAHVAIRCGFVPSLLCFLDVQDVPSEQRQWSQEQRRKVQLEALSALFQLVQFVPDAFIEAQGNAVVLKLLHTTHSREVQKKCLHLLQVAVRTGPSFAEELGRLGGVGLLIELFGDRDNLMSSRQLCASVLAGLCSNHPDNCREFRKKDGIEALKQEIAYRPDKTTDNHLFYTLCVVDCVWCAVVGTRKNEMRFLDAGGLFALLDVLEVAPLLLKRQIIGCLADLVQYRKAAKLFAQWNSQTTMKGAVKILLELWQNEQETVGSTAPNGVLRDLERPLNPQAQGPSGSPLGGGASADSGSTRGSVASGKLRHARSFADAAGGRAKAGATQPSKLAGTLNGSAASPSGNLTGDAAEKQDCRAKIYVLLNRVGFESQEVLGIAEKQQMELVKLYPEAMQLETWVEVSKRLHARGVKPISADQKWIEDSITERTGQASSVQGMQQKLADQRHNEELAGLNRFYDDIRVRAQLRRAASATRSDATTPADGGYPPGPQTSGPLGPVPPSSGDESP